MDSSVNSANDSNKIRASRYPNTEWEMQKANVERLYVTEGRPLKEVIQVLKEEHNFIANEKQIKSRLSKWGFDVKNLKTETTLELARIKAKRAALENKKSSFRVNKKPVDDRKIDRYVRRKDISEEDLLDMASPAGAPSPGFSVFTPQSARSSAPPSPGLNFQTLSLTESNSPVTPTGPFHEYAGLLKVWPVPPPGFSIFTPQSAFSSAPPSTSLNPQVMPRANSDSPVSSKALPIIVEEDSSRASVTQSPHITASLPPIRQFQTLSIREPGAYDQPTIVEDITDVPHQQENLENEDQPEDQSSPSVAWEFKKEEEAAKRHNLSESRYQAYKARRYPGYRANSSSIDERFAECWVWSCDSCGHEGGMTIFIDYCSFCGHLRCSMCPVEYFSLSCKR